MNLIERCTKIWKDEFDLPDVELVFCKERAIENMKKIITLVELSSATKKYDDHSRRL